MSDTPRPKKFRIEWLKPMWGALCFGVLMYVSMALGARDHAVFGASFLVIVLAAVVAGHRTTKPYSSSALGIYIFAGGCLIFGAALLAARA